MPYKFKIIEMRLKLRRQIFTCDRCHIYNIDDTCREKKEVIADLERKGWKIKGSKVHCERCKHAHRF